MSEHPTIGVLAYQGDIREHRRILDSLGVRSLEVRTLADLDRVDGLIVPGGESTVIGKLTERYGLLEPLRERARAGLPMLGTCAGMIFMAREVEGPPQQLLKVLDVRVRRNAFGPQVAAFIRAPWASDPGPDVEVLAEIDGRVIGARQGNLLAVAFHPELTGDARLHRWFVDLARAAAERGVHGQPPDPAYPGSARIDERKGIPMSGH